MPVGPQRRNGVTVNKLPSPTPHGGWGRPVPARRPHPPRGISAPDATPCCLTRGNTIRMRAGYSLRIAEELEKWPREHHFTKIEIEAMATAWATQSLAKGRSSSAENPKRTFRIVAAAFLRSLGRLDTQPPTQPGPYDGLVEDFIHTQRQKTWQSEETCRRGRCTVVAFLSYLENRGCDLRDINAEHVDSYFKELGQSLKRTSLHTVAGGLRTWLRYCENRGLINTGLADGMLLPRIYRQEELPLGPTWDQVTRMIAAASGDDPQQLRNQALLRLLAVYGLRSGEIRRLRLEDIDWQQDRIRVIRSKSLRLETLPLEPTVGNAITSYLRHGRPKSQSRTLFLTVRAPYRALSAPAVHKIVRRYLSIVGLPAKGYGPQGLRHACARHFLEAGLSLKEAGDLLGHRSPDSTRIYCKVNLASLRLVPFEPLGGLA